MASLKIFQLWLVMVLAVLISAIGPVKSWPSGLGVGGQNFGPASKAQYGQYKLLRMATQGLGQKPWFLQFLSPSKFFFIFWPLGFLHFFTIYFMLDGLSGQKKEKTIKKIVLTIFPNSLWKTIIILVYHLF